MKKNVATELLNKLGPDYRVEVKDGKYYVLDKEGNSVSTKSAGELVVNTTALVPVETVQQVNATTEVPATETPAEAAEKVAEALTKPVSFVVKDTQTGEIFSRGGIKRFINSYSFSELEKAFPGRFEKITGGHVRQSAKG